MADRVSIGVIGSVNLDMVATADTLPAPGQTVTGAALARFPGGKGANQALAARRLGADVRLLARIGRDGAADEALALLRAGGVDLDGCLAEPDRPTGTALIVVAPDGENQIVVAPGANAAFTPDKLPDRLDALGVDALMCQLEVPLATVAQAAAGFAGFFCLNVAPAAAVPADLLARCDLLVMNETEARMLGDALAGYDGLAATTLGARGAVLTRRGEELARARPPKVVAVDATGAGDAFTAALTVALLEGRAPDDALRLACTVGALTATKPGAQPSFPSRAEVEAVLAGR